MSKTQRTKGSRDNSAKVGNKHASNRQTCALEALNGVDRLALEIPTKTPAELSHRRRHVDAKLTQRQAEALCYVFTALLGRARLWNGRPVETAADAVRWILDKIASGVGLSATFPLSPAEDDAGAGESKHTPGQ